jgi:Fe2+ transport system protein FeoA
MRKLTDIQPGTRDILKEVLGGKRLQTRLIGHGLLEGKAFLVLERLGQGATVLVQIEGSKLAIGRGIAEKILVQPEEGLAGLFG